MIKKLALDSLTADLANIDYLLLDRTAQSDPVGHMQFSQRKERIQREIDQLKATPELKASVGLFFSGGPVIGSKGIKADFVGKAIEGFQDLVAKQFASEETGSTGSRGPIPFKQNSDLLLTDMVRGSVGVVLEEAGQNETVTETQLKIVMDHVADAILSSSGVNAEDFEGLLERIDHRYLTSLANLFTLLDDEHALIRIVEDMRDIQLGELDIKRARDRLNSAQIDEDDSSEFSGRLYRLPAHRRFELALLDGLTTIYGTISPEFAKTKLNEILLDGNVVGQTWKVRLHTRTISRPNREPKITYTLLGLIEEIH